MTTYIWSDESYRKAIKSGIRGNHWEAQATPNIRRHSSTGWLQNQPTDRLLKNNQPTNGFHRLNFTRRPNWIDQRWIYPGVIIRSVLSNRLRLYMQISKSILEKDAVFMLLMRVVSDVVVRAKNQPIKMLIKAEQSAKSKSTYPGSWRRIWVVSLELRETCENL